MLLKLAIQKAVGQPRDQPAHAPAARTAITWTWCFLLPNLLWIHHIPTWKDTGRIGGERAQHGQGHPKKTEKMLRPVNVFSINKFIYFLFEGPLQRQHLHLQGFQWIALRSGELNSDQMLTNYENLVVIPPLPETWLTKALGIWLSKFVEEVGGALDCEKHQLVSWTLHSGVLRKCCAKLRTCLRQPIQYDGYCVVWYTAWNPGNGSNQQKQ